MVACNRICFKEKKKRGEMLENFQTIPDLYVTLANLQINQKPRNAGVVQPSLGPCAC